MGLWYILIHESVTYLLYVIISNMFQRLNSTNQHYTFNGFIMFIWCYQILLKHFQNPFFKRERNKRRKNLQDSITILSDKLAGPLSLTRPKQGHLFSKRRTIYGTSEMLYVRLFIKKSWLYRKMLYIVCSITYFD